MINKYHAPVGFYAAPPEDLELPCKGCHFLTDTERCTYGDLSGEAAPSCLKDYRADETSVIFKLKLEACKGKPSWFARLIRR